MILQRWIDFLPGYVRENGRSLSLIASLALDPEGARSRPMAKSSRTSTYRRFGRVPSSRRALLASLPALRCGPSGDDPSRSQAERAQQGPSRRHGSHPPCLAVRWRAAALKANNLILCQVGSQAALSVSFKSFLTESKTSRYAPVRRTPPITIRNQCGNVRSEMCLGLSKTSFFMSDVRKKVKAKA